MPARGSVSRHLLTTSDRRLKSRPAGPEEGECKNGIDRFWIAHIEVTAMASILTPEDVVRRIAAECTYIDERGAVGIRLNPAAVIVRQYGEQFRRPVRPKQNRRPKPPPLL